MRSDFPLPPILNWVRIKKNSRNFWCDPLMPCRSCSTCECEMKWQVSDATWRCIFDKVIQTKPAYLYKLSSLILPMLFSVEIFHWQSNINMSWPPNGFPYFLIFLYQYLRITFCDHDVRTKFHLWSCQHERTFEAGSFKKWSFWKKKLSSYILEPQCFES